MNRAAKTDEPKTPERAQNHKHKRTAAGNLGLSLTKLVKSSGGFPATEGFAVDSENSA